MAINVGEQKCVCDNAPGKKKKKKRLKELHLLIATEDGDQTDTKIR